MFRINFFRKQAFLLLVFISLLSSCNENDDDINMVDKDNIYQTMVDIWADKVLYQHNVIGFTGTIDWGDGYMDEYKTATDYPQHTYAEGGLFKVTAIGTATALCSEKCKARVIVNILHIGSDCGIQSMRMAFFKQTKLESIPAGIFDGLGNVKDFSWMFAAGTDDGFYDMAITSVPDGLFDKCSAAETFERTFYSCQQLKTIPEGLFDKCTKVTNFNCTFGGNKVLEEIPAGLFDNCPLVTDFGECFMGTAAVKKIPEGLFKNCPKVTSFWNLFAWSGIEYIPEDIFAYNTKVTNFERTFRNCDYIKKIPEKVFAACPDVTTFNMVFENCDGISSVPAGLFDNNRKTLDFTEAFMNTKITGESPYTLVDGVKIHLYERSNYPEYFTKPTSYSRCFYECAGLTDYRTIPSEWK